MGIAGCQPVPPSDTSAATGPSPVSNALAAYFRQMIDTHESQFVKDVLDDFHITEAGYAEAREELRLRDRRGH